MPSPQPGATRNTSSCNDCEKSHRDGAPPATGGDNADDLQGTTQRRFDPMEKMRDEARERHIELQRQPVGWHDGRFIEPDGAKTETMNRLRLLNAEVDGLRNLLQVLADEPQLGKWPPAQLEFMGGADAVVEHLAVQMALAPREMRQPAVLRGVLLDWRGYVAQETEAMQRQVPRASNRSTRVASESAVA